MGFGKDGLGVIINEKRSQALGTLAADTAIIIGTKLVILERFRMLKSEMLCTLRGATSGEARGLALYLFDGDYTLAEIDQALENNGPLGPNDTVQSSITERFSKLVGVFDDETGTESQIHDAMSNAPMVTTKPRWTFARTKSWNWVLYNHGAALTTGSTVHIQAKSFGVWVT